MSRCAKITDTMKYIKKEHRKEQLLEVACKLAEAGHYRLVSRIALAEATGTATGNVSRVMGGMLQMRHDLIEYAILNDRHLVTAQAILDRHPATDGLTEDQRAIALSSAL